MTTLPTLQQLYTSILANLESEYGVNISLIGKVALRAIAATQAGKLKLFYLVIGNLQKNIFVDTAESENIGGTLERFGRVKLGRNPFPAIAGQYVIQIKGTVGAIIKASTTFKSDDSSLSPGMLFVLDNEYILVSTTDTITVRALTTGVISKLNISDTLTATSPIALVESSATVISQYVQPFDMEDLEAYRLATINSYRLEAQGGSGTDYRLWSADAQGVKYIYPYAKSGYANEINLFVEATIADSTDGKGTPSQVLLDAVESDVEFDPDTSLPTNQRGRRPLGIFEIHYLPVTIREVDIIITGAIGFTADQKAALLIAITDTINLIRPFVASSDVLSNKNDILDANKLIATIIQTQPGALFSGVTFKIDSVLLSTYTFLGGDIPHFNSIAYV